MPGAVESELCKFCRVGAFCGGGKPCPYQPPNGIRVKARRAAEKAGDITSRRCLCCGPCRGCAEGPGGDEVVRSAFVVRRRGPPARLPSFRQPRCGLPQQVYRAGIANAIARHCGGARCSEDRDGAPGRSSCSCCGGNNSWCVARAESV